MNLLLDDKRAALRLADTPEFLLRPDEFVAAFGASGRPGIILQARPVASAILALEVDDAELQKRFLAGAGNRRGWWDSFNSSIRVRPTMHGIGSASAHERPDWALEAHADGHFIAGVWNFPEREHKGVSVPGIAYWYGEVFDDFLSVVEGALGGGSQGTAYITTLTIVGGKSLHYFAKSIWADKVEYGAKPHECDIVQYPVWQVTLPSSDRKSVAAKMTRALLGSYGAVPPGGLTQA